jgi:hypothetical protein
MTNELNHITLDPEAQEQLKKIVLERMSIMPDSLRVAVGDSDFSKKDLISHVKEGDEIGRQMMTMELEFLKALASGAVYKNE